MPGPEVTILDVLNERYAGKFVFTGDPDDYNRMEWHSADPRPTEEQLRAQGAEVGVILAVRRAKVAAEEGLSRIDPAPLLLTVQMSIAGFRAIYRNLDPDTKARLDADPEWQMVVAAGAAASEG